MLQLPGQAPPGQMGGFTADSGGGAEKGREKMHRSDAGTGNAMRKDGWSQRLLAALLMASVGQFACGGDEDPGPEARAPAPAYAQAIGIDPGDGTRAMQCFGSGGYSGSGSGLYTHFPSYSGSSSPYGSSGY